jgi:hypothetical protein
MHSRSIGTVLGLVPVLPLVMLSLGGCGTGSSHPADIATTPTSFVTRVERQCGVVYTRPSIKGEALGFTCGETASGVHFAAAFTRRLRCSLFMTLSDTDGDRFQQCLSSPPRTPRGAILCPSGRQIFAARTTPGTQSATLLMSSGQRATSRILVLNIAGREHWGGFVFDVRASRIPERAALIERGQGGRTVGHLSLTPVPGCHFANGVNRAVSTSGRSG